MKRLLILGVVVAVVIAAGVAIAANGGGGGSGNSSGSTTPSMNAATVSTRNIGDQGVVVVDSAGRALYASEQEAAAGNKVLCEEGCTSFWKPLTLSKGSPTGSSISGKLGIMKRPDGSRQVTLDGKLLYSFAEDQPGEVNGEGFEDAFNGQTLTWHVVHPDGSTGTPDNGGTSTGPFGY